MSVDDLSRLKASENEGRTPDTESSPRGHLNSLLMGLAFVVVGVFALLVTTGNFSMQNWWVLFLLIPIAYLAAQTFRSYQAEGKLAGNARWAILGTLTLTTVFFIFLFGLDWGRIWPIFIILGGISLFLGRWLD